MKRKRYLALSLVVVMLLSLTACGADSSPDAGDTQPTENSQDWGPGVIGLQEEVDISTFEKAMALWDIYADQAQPQPDGPLVLEFVFPSQNRARIWRFDADNRFDVRLDKPSGDYWEVFYWLDGSTMGRLSKETNLDGTYVELEDMQKNPEGKYLLRKTYAADETILLAVGMIDNYWSVCYYEEVPERITTEERVKELVKAAYTEVDISQQEKFSLSINENENVDTGIWVTHQGDETSILYTVDEENYYMSNWIGGEENGFVEQRTVNGYYYRFESKEVEYTIEGNKGIANYPDYPNGKQITFKVLPDKTYGAKAYPLTEHRDGMDIQYCYVSDDSSYCNQAYVTDHKTGDYLVFALDSVRDPSHLDYFISVDWTHNGVTTHYDEDKNPLGILVYKIPWFPSDEIGVPWVSPPLRAVS